MHRVRRALAFVRRASSYVPIRLPGLALAAVGYYVAFRIGKKESDYLLFPAGVAALALIGVCLVCVLTGAALLRRQVRRAAVGVPEDLETTHARRTGFRFSRFALWPLVEVRMTWETPGAVDVTLDKEGRWFLESITPHERGRHKLLVRRFVVSDVFGLCAVAFRARWSEPFCIAPAAATHSADLASSFSHGDSFSHPAGRAEGDLVEMRAYGHGDPLRHVLWKTFARTRRLLVRMPERAIAPKPITVAFLVAGDSDEATAATARLYIEKGLFGNDFLFCADGAQKPTGRTPEAIDQIVDSVRARDSGGESMDALAAQVEQARLAACVVFVPPVDGPWRARVAAFARKLPALPTIIIGVEGDETTPRRSVVNRVLVAAPRPPIASATGAALLALRAALEADGLRVQVLHRRSGELS